MVMVLIVLMGYSCQFPKEIIPANPSLPRWHPDILHLRRLMQELVTFALLVNNGVKSQSGKRALV